MWIHERFRLLRSKQSPNVFNKHSGVNAIKLFVFCGSSKSLKPYILNFLLAVERLFRRFARSGKTAPCCSLYISNVIWNIILFKFCAVLAWGYITILFKYSCEIGSVGYADFFCNLLNGHICA